MLCQGWKESPCIYQTLGAVATSYIREVGVPSSQYIDDRHVGELWGVPGACSSYQAALSGVVLAIAVLTKLGYFINTEKSVALPTQRLVFLAHLVDTVRETFSTPEDKKEKFTTFRDVVLLERTVSLNTPEFDGSSGKTLHSSNSVRYISIQSLSKAYSDDR